MCQTLAWRLITYQQSPCLERETNTNRYRKVLLVQGLLNQQRTVDYEGSVQPESIRKASEFNRFLKTEEVVQQTRRARARAAHRKMPGVLQHGMLSKLQRCQEWKWQQRGVRAGGYLARPVCRGHLRPSHNLYRLYLLRFYLLLESTSMKW